MYRDFYGLRERPFNLTPDTSFLYPSRVHKEVLTHLLYGINSRCGFILITGEVGAGKTTLCRVLLNQLDEQTKVAFVLNSFLTECGLLRAINQDFGLATGGRAKMDLLNELNAYLLEQNRLGHNVVIVIDEAQNLSAPVLEQIRMLSNLETEKEKLLQIVLVGQPELRRKLASRRLRQLNQRITVRYHLTPLGRGDVRNYIYYRLKVAGARNGVVFTRAALDEVFYLSGGVPRLINVLCDRALMVGFAKSSHRITRAMVCRAASETTGQRRTEATVGSFFSMRLSLPRVAMAMLWMIPFITVGILGAIGNARGRTARLTGPAAIAHAATAQEGAPQQAAAYEAPAPDGERAPEGSSSLARAMREGSAGSTLGAPLSSIHSTKPLRKSYAKPNIDFTPPAQNFTPATVADASFSSVVEPMVQLLLHWKVETSVVTQIRREWLGRSEINLAEIARAAGMGVARQTCSFDELVGYNLPAVIAIKHDGSRPHYITLLSIKGDVATVCIRSKQVVVELSTVRELYDGEAILFASDTFVSAKQLNEKTGLDLDVRKLQDYLRTLGYFPGSPTGWFTAETKTAVLGFQSDHSIAPTGVADNATKFRLYALVPPEGIPQLIR